MNITSVKYTYDDDNNIDVILAVIDGENLGVPVNEDNRHYVAIQKWLAAGNKVTE